MKLLLRCVLAAFLLSVFGCGLASHLGEYHYTHISAVAGNGEVFSVYVDKYFGEADKISIQQALDQWNYVLNGHAKFVIVDDQFDMDPSILQMIVNKNAFLILKITSANPIVPNIGPGYWILGFVPVIGNHWIYLVRDRMNNNDIKYITMHEVGHALGAKHTDSGVMFKYYLPEEYQCVDYSAAKQVAAWYHWDVNELNYCMPGLEGASTTSTMGNLRKDQQSH
jgi:hypothetical protein